MHADHPRIEIAVALFVIIFRILFSWEVVLAAISRLPVSTASCTILKVAARRHKVHRQHDFGFRNRLIILLIWLHRRPIDMSLNHPYKFIYKHKNNSQNVKVPIHLRSEIILLPFWDGNRKGSPLLKGQI